MSSSSSSHMTNPLATAEQLYQRNNLSSLPNDLQDVVLYMTQCLTQAAGVLLQLPQSVTAQANVILARYWLAETRPLLASEFSDVSAACIFLVTKLGPRPRSSRDISNVYAYLLSPVSTFMRSPSSSALPPPVNDPAAYYQSEATYYASHARILALEARILYTLSFDTHVALPHPLAVTYLQALDFCHHQPREQLARRALAHLNAALLSPQLLYVTHQPHMLAVAAVYVAAREVGARTPDCEWWEVFDVEREELGFLVVALRSLEGWVEAVRARFAWMGEGMVTRARVRDEAKARGGGGDGAGGNGNGGVGGEDEEDAMMRAMDEKTATKLVDED